MPPPAPIFEKWMDENDQISYIIWPKVTSSRVTCMQEQVVVYIIWVILQNVASGPNYTGPMKSVLLW